MYGIISRMIAVGLVGIPMAATANECGALRVRHTAGTRSADAALVSRLGRQPVTAGEIGTVLAYRGWRLIWATPADAERGIFFFRPAKGGKLRFVKAWGGVIPPGERTSTIRWVGTHYGRPPERLVGCFVDTVIAE